MAVGTAAPPANIEVVLDTLGLRQRFATIVSPSQGFRGKPHPDMFLAAAERMKVDPADCIVFEDAPLGVEAARRAGMRAVALLTPVSYTHLDVYKRQPQPLAQPLARQRDAERPRKHLRIERQDRGAEGHAFKQSAAQANRPAP